MTDVPRKPESITPMGAGLVPGGMSTVYPVKISVIDPHLSVGVVVLACPSVSICLSAPLPDGQAGVHLRMHLTFSPYTTRGRSEIFEATERPEDRVSSPLAYSPIAT